MDIASIGVFFLFGIIFGSFFNVIGLRMPLKQSFTGGRSACPQCGHQLTWYELVPLVSFIIQQGKCRQCGKKIALLYPVIELATGGLFVISASLIGWNAELITALLLVSMLMIILVSDLTYMVIPDKVLLFFLPLLGLMRFIMPLEPWWTSLIGGFLGLVLLALVILISRGGMGGGDMKLFGILGLVLGLNKMLLTFFLSTVIGALIGVTLLMSEVVSRKQPVPFGPYIVIGALISYFSGDFLVNWYVELLI